MRENSNRGEIVGRVLAVDEDRGLFGHVIYQVQESEADEDWKSFTVDPEDGTIYVESKIEREIRDQMGKLVVKDKYYVSHVLRLRKGLLVLLIVNW